jgi:hypothetical protein
MRSMSRTRACKKSAADPSLCCAIPTTFSSNCRRLIYRLSFSDPADPDRELNENDALVPGPGAILAGPTFEEWLISTS